MRKGKKLSQIVMIVVLCMMILYAGMNRNWKISENVEAQMQNQLLHHLEKMYIPSLYYVSEGQNNLPQKWYEECVSYFLPLGSYVNLNGSYQLNIEDSDTYKMILAYQASDENEVDEKGELVQEKKTENSENSKLMSVTDLSMEKLENYEYLLENFYTVDSSTSVTKKDLDAKKLLAKDMKIQSELNGPKILIYHTHSQESFKDSKKGDASTTIMGMGEYLSQLLNEKYGIETLHHQGIYDLVEGKLDRSLAYQLAEKDISKILKKYPSIEVVIDLHRDGVGKDTHLVTEINGKKTAQIMFFNGMSRSRKNGDIEYLYNPYIEDNLAASLQMQVNAMKYYPGYARHIYLKSYRYNMHLKPKSLLIEAGAQTNTVQEMRNSMEILADLISKTFQGQ